MRFRLSGRPLQHSNALALFLIHPENRSSTPTEEAITRASWGMTKEENREATMARACVTRCAHGGRPDLVRSDRDNPGTARAHSGAAPARRATGQDAAAGFPAARVRLALNLPRFVRPGEDSIGRE